MISHKDVFAFDIVDLIVIFSHLQNSTIHPRRRGFSFKNAGERLMIRYYSEMCALQVVMKITTSENYR